MSSYSEIRDILGVKASDNLVNANYVLIVEGEEDVVSLKALLPRLSASLAKALNNNILVIDSIGGGRKPLIQTVHVLRHAVCLPRIA